MLVLSRKLGEKIVIADNIEIRVIKVEGKNVRLGIQAPDDVKVYREEVYDKYNNKDDQAATGPEEPEAA